jgi:glycosyltransferase involved in cell wall biosynthesis
MTLMDEPYTGSTPREVLLSNPTRRDHPRVSVVLPVGKTSDVTSMLGRLPGLEAEVILVDRRRAHGDMEAARALRPDVRVTRATGVGDAAALRAGFAAARGDYIVVLDGDGETDAREIERFVAALHAGCVSVGGTAA